MGTQGNPSRNLCIQASDLSEPQLHMGPITGGQGKDKGRVEEWVGLVSLGVKEGRKGAAEGDEEGLGSQFPQIRQQEFIKGPGGGDGLPGSGEGRPEAQITEDGAVQLPVEATPG
jgi:hypothetical protein